VSWPHGVGQHHTRPPAVLIFGPLNAPSANTSIT
jgi:hypothetical protein